MSTGNAVRQAALAAGWSHRHRDVSGGWLRPTVFGAVDGLVTNTSLIAGLGAGGVSAHTIVLTGVAALVAGAFSMGTGEYVSVTNQNELVHAEVATERTMHARFPAAEQAELADTFIGYDADLETALREHTREELGVDPFELPSALFARHLLAGRLLRRGAHPAAAVPGGPVRPGRLPGYRRGGAADRRHGGGPAHRPADAALGPAPARPGRVRRRGHVSGGQPRRRPACGLTSRVCASS